MEACKWLYAACLSGKFCLLIFDKCPFVGVRQLSVGAASTIFMASLYVALALRQHGVGSQSTVR